LYDPIKKGRLEKEEKREENFLHSDRSKMDRWREPGKKLGMRSKIMKLKCFSTYWMFIHEIIPHFCRFR
jgi:hypothetical protein